MPWKMRFPTRDEWICLSPAIGVTVSFLTLAVCGAAFGWLPRTLWTVLLTALVGVFLAFGLTLTPPVLHARERMLKASIIEPAEVDLEPDFDSDGGGDKKQEGGENAEEDRDHDA